MKSTSVGAHGRIIAVDLFIFTSIPLLVFSFSFILDNAVVTEHRVL